MCYFPFIKRYGFAKTILALPLDWETLEEEELRYLNEEEARIVYVGATRAEKALILSSSTKSNNKNPWKELLDIEQIQQVEVTDEDEVISVPNVISLKDYRSHTTEPLGWLKQS